MSGAGRPQRASHHRRYTRPAAPPGRRVAAIIAPPALTRTTTPLINYFDRGNLHAFRAVCNGGTGAELRGAFPGGEFAEMLGYPFRQFPHLRDTRVKASVLREGG